MVGLGTTDWRETQAALKVEGRRRSEGAMARGSSSRRLISALAAGAITRVPRDVRASPTKSTPTNGVPRWAIWLTVGWATRSRTSWTRPSGAHSSGV